MRYPQGDLAILSAEVYGSGVSLRPQEQLTAAKKTRNPASGNSEDGPRKRARIHQTESGSTEDGKKKSRGRPRVDAQDQTAADRRRTQIRLAQRAYRNRKETTIQTLEKRVQQLKEINEEMSNTFMQLHDFAVSAGLLEQIPAFGDQLRLTTEKFLTLARLANDDGAKDYEESVIDADRNPLGKGPGSDGAPSDPQRQTSGGSPIFTATSTETTVAPTAEGPKEQLYGGIVVTYEPVNEADLETTFPSSAPEPPTTSTLDYGIAADPSLETASFRAPSKPSLAFLEQLVASSPYFGLDAPASYCSLETTFGRRLQRFAVQCGLALITMPYPPQRVISQVFGFCLLFETPEDIKYRLSRVLGHNTQQSLSNWKYPFFHLGRAGAHFGMTTATTQRFGNQGTIDVDKPEATAGFATGPFTAEINSVRDHFLDKDMRMVVPGFGYEYYDCDEIEMYLYQRGVVIPPGADYITADIDPSHFDNGAWQADPFSDLDFVSMPPDSAGRGKSSVSSCLSPEPEPSLGSGPTLAEPSPPGPDMSATPWPLPETTGLVEPTIADLFPHAGAYLPTETTTPSTFLSPTDSNNLLTFPLLPPSGDSIPGMDTTNPAAQKPTRKRVVVDVSLLVKEMTMRSICLGRTPGLKQDDINAAFWAAVQVDLP
ncbi:hypothetical protein MFIFM68171_05814 [Madurella fahalii]|uniref:BZIP domain-containing protein n=1 Tax=Madurella fahalii TaxID=1157608 RepID=A0ABQ0GD00_9PEZI